MTTQINQTVFRSGRVDAKDFARDCHHGDWQFWDVAYPTIPGDGPTGDEIAVILTALGTADQRSAPVGVVANVTPDGFLLAARNSACVEGSMGFSWMAVAERPGTQQAVPDLRMGIMQPLHFSPDCHTGDWHGVELPFSFTVREPAVLVTASNMNITPFSSSHGLAYHNAAAVAVVEDNPEVGLLLGARNSDCAEGDCAFYYLQIGPDGQRDDLWIETGRLFGQEFGADCHSQDWRNWVVTFRQPFLTPPMVYVTAQVVTEDFGERVAAVGIAQNVTTHGFTLGARNSDCSTGMAGFHWVAIGCDLGCGGPPIR